MARFVGRTNTFGLEFTDESLAELERILKEHAAAASLMAVGEAGSPEGARFGGGYAEAQHVCRHHPTNRADPGEPETARPAGNGAASEGNRPGVKLAQRPEGGGKTAPVGGAQTPTAHIKSQIAFVNPTGPKNNDGLPEQISITAVGLDPAKSYQWLQFFSVDVAYDNGNGPTVWLTGEFSANFGNNKQDYTFGKEYLDNVISGWKFTRQALSADRTSLKMTDQPSVATKSDSLREEFIKRATKANNGVTPKDGKGSRHVPRGPRPTECEPAADGHRRTGVEDDFRDYKWPARFRGLHDAARL